MKHLGIIFAIIILLWLAIDAILNSFSYHTFVGLILVIVSLLLGMILKSFFADK